MGYLIIMTIVLSVSGLFLGLINYRINKLKEENRLNIETVSSIIALNKAMKKLNEALRTESRSLSDYKQRLRSLEKRIDILESGHPNSEFDYATTDDHDNIVEVWVDGKKYILEDEPDSDVIKLYADNKVVAETTKSEVKCCATCQHYRPGSGFSTCDLRTWLHATKKYATMADSACNNYEKTSAVLVPSDKDKVEYIRYDKQIDDLQLKIDYITLCQEQDKLRNKEIGFNKLLSSAMQSGIMSAREWREFMEDLDSDT